MLDKLLAFAAVFDWISPLAAEIQDHVNGPTHTFMIPDDCGCSGFDIEHLLKSYGIKPWRRMIVNGNIMLTVRLAQAHYAQYLLLREQIPIEYGLLDDRAARAAAWTTMDTSRASVVPMATPKRGFFAELAHAVDNLVDEVEALFGL
jgi:hypothetical protein